MLCPLLSFAASASSWDECLAILPPDVDQKLEFWLCWLSSALSAPFKACRSRLLLLLACDASAIGWGALSLEGPQLTARGFFTAEERL